MAGEIPFVFVQGMPVDRNGRIIRESHARAVKPRKDLVVAYWANVAEVVLPRFPELQVGEKVSATEIKARLSAIRETGYEVPNYSRLSRRAAWGLFSRIRTDVYRNARIYCPDVSEQIRERNIAHRTRDLTELG